MKINFDFKKIINQAFDFLKEKRVFCLWFLAICCLLAAAGLFWRFAWNLSIPSDNQSGLTKIDSSSYERILERLRKKEIRFQGDSQASHRDIFR